jgi:hypothetical protein
MRWPVATDPVKATRLVPSEVTRASPTSAPPETRLTTPAGKPAKASARRRVASGV